MAQDGGSAAENPSVADAARDPDAIEGGPAPRYMPPMRRRPPAVGEPTPAQARAVARAGLALTVLLAAAGLAGVVWAVLAVLGVAR